MPAIPLTTEPMPEIGMRALTFTNPYGPLIISGDKRYETRSFRTHIRGPILIHAAKLYPGWAKRLSESAIFCRSLGWPEPPQRITQEWCEEMKRRIEDLPCGCIIGQANVINCVPVERIRGGLSAKELAFGDYSDGRFAWEMGSPRRLPPWPAKGLQGFWNWKGILNGKR